MREQQRYKELEYKSLDILSKVFETKIFTGEKVVDNRKLINLFNICCFLSLISRYDCKIISLSIEINFLDSLANTLAISLDH